MSPLRLWAALATCALVVLLAPSESHPRTSRLAHCKRSPVIQVMFFCGVRVMYRNPDGSVVKIGSRKDMSAPQMHLLPAPSS